MNGYALSALIVLTMVVSPVVKASTYLQYCIRTEGEPVINYGAFYGYSSSTKGPGNNSFTAAKKLAESNKMPFYVVYGKDTCATCDKLAAYINDKNVTSYLTLGQISGIKGYFRGSNDGSTPTACAQAREFFNELARIDPKHAAVPGSCHMFGVYRVFPNGDLFARATAMPTTPAEMNAQAKRWVEAYEADLPNHLRKPVLSSSVFACLAVSLCEGNGKVYVPFARTNSFDTIEKNALKVLKQNGQAVTNDFVWAKNELRKEIPLQLNWAKDGEYKLILINTNGLEVATNVVKCVAAESNGFENPRYLGEADAYVFGEWTLDFNVATGGVWAANSYKQAFTLAVSGGSTTDAQLQAYAADVFASTNFQAWATNNNVALVLLDCTNNVGRGLLTHSHAGESCYISQKGLRAYASTVPAAGDEVALSAEEMQTQLNAWNTDYRKLSTSAFEIILIRPDGTVAGRLAPHIVYDAKTKTWSCDAAENVARLDELLLEVGDKTEEANGGDSTKLTFQWGETKNSQTLAISDREDCYKLTDTQGWSGKKVVFEITGTNVRPEAQPSVEVLIDGTVVKPEVTYLYLDNQIVAETNYTFTAAAIQNGKVIVRAKAFDGVAATTTKFGGNTRFGYTLKARQMKAAPGIVSFVGESDIVIRDETNKTYQVSLARVLGYKGTVSATVCVSEALTTATNMYEFTPQTVTWKDGEDSVKYIDITLKGSDFNDGMKTIVLTNSVAVPEIDEKVYNLIDAFSISYGKEPSEEGQMGILLDQTVPVASEDGRIYVRYDEKASELVRTYVNRTGGKGAAVGYLSLVSGGKTLKKTTLVWPEYRTGTKMWFWDAVAFPAPNARTGYADATVKLTSSNGFAIAKGYDTLNVRVLAKDAPRFEVANMTWGNAVQYVAFSNAVEMLYGTSQVHALPTGWTVQGAMKVQGELPKGLKCAADKVTGALVITGTPTAAGETQTSVWWMKFKDAQGNLVMSSPVTLKMTVTALAYDPEARSGLIPGFDQARSWTGLPLVDIKTKRLDGLLDLTVAKNGRTSAKWRKAGGKTVSFSAASLTGCLQSEKAGTNVFVNAEKMQSGVRNTFSVSFWANGSVSGRAAEYNSAGTEIVALADFAMADAGVWSKENPADAWAGNYTLAFPHDDLAGAFDVRTLCYGPATLRVKFDTAAQINKGQTTFAGTLPNGKSVSGSATLVPTDEKKSAWAQLPIFFSNAAETFGAMVELPSEGDLVAAAEGVTNFWSHVESNIPEASYDNDYASFGVRYETEDWSKRWAADYGTNVLSFAVDGEDAGARVKANKTSLSVSDKGTVALVFQLNKTSGVAAGSFRADTTGKGRLSTITWRGVALPGLPEFAVGAYSYSTNFPYSTGKTRTLKAGGSVSLIVPEINE